VSENCSRSAFGRRALRTENPAEAERIRTPSGACTGGMTDSISRPTPATSSTCTRKLKPQRHAIPPNGAFGGELVIRLHTARCATLERPLATTSCSPREAKTTPARLPAASCAGTLLVQPSFMTCVRHPSVSCVCVCVAQSANTERVRAFRTATLAIGLGDAGTVGLDKVVPSERLTTCWKYGPFPRPSSPLLTCCR